MHRRAKACDLRFRDPTVKSSLTDSVKIAYQARLREALTRGFRFRATSLDARDNYSGSTLAELYDPLIMPADLKRAHQRLDRAVDHLYRHKRFESERERVEHLLRMYEKAHA